MNPLDRVLLTLKGIRATGPGRWMARCPAHEDSKASLSLATGEDGRARVKGHAGRAVAAITAAVGLRLRDLMPDRETSSKWNGRGRKKAPGRSFPTAEAVEAWLLAGMNRGAANSWVVRATHVYHDANG